MSRRILENLSGQCNFSSEARDDVIEYIVAGRNDAWTIMQLRTLFNKKRALFENILLPLFPFE